MDFSDDEIREELARLGYNSVPSDKLAEFKRDLYTLINSEKSKSSSLNSSIEDDPADIELSKKDHEHAARNVSNHGSQWIDQFNEDWDYRGVGPSKTIIKGDHQDIEHRPKTAPINRDFQVPAPYSMYENPPIQDHFNESNSSGRCVKRKTCRKSSSGVKRIDESFSESDYGEAFDAYERLKCKDSEQRKPSLPQEARVIGSSRAPSWIRKTTPPHDRRPKQMTCHELMNKYNKVWNAHPTPGEKPRSAVVNAVKAKLMKNFEIQKPIRVYVPNDYKRPHEKTRSSLRWEVRTAVENYQMPRHGVYHAVDSL